MHCRARRPKKFSKRAILPTDKSPLHEETNSEQRDPLQNIDRIKIGKNRRIALSHCGGMCRKEAKSQQQHRDIDCDKTHQRLERRFSHPIPHFQRSDELHLSDPLGDWSASFYSDEPVIRTMSENLIKLIVTSIFGRHCQPQATENL